MATPNNAEHLQVDPSPVPPGDVFTLEPFPLVWQHRPRHPEYATEFAALRIETIQLQEGPSRELALLALGQWESEP